MWSGSVSSSCSTSFERQDVDVNVNIKHNPLKVTSLKIIASNIVFHGSQVVCNDNSLDVVWLSSSIKMVWSLMFQKNFVSVFLFIANNLISLTDLIQSHVCACPSPGPGFTSTYVVVLLWLIFWGETWLFFVILAELLILSFHNFSTVFIIETYYALLYVYIFL